MIREKYSIYGKLSFTNYIELNEDTLLKILEWRNDFNVRKWMNNDLLISQEEHFTFLKTLNNNKNKIYWIVSKNNQLIGTVNINLLENKQAEWGYFISPDYLNTGIAFELCFESIRFFFNEFKLESLIGNVKTSNDNNIKLQSYFGFKKEGKSKNGFIKLVLKKQIFDILPLEYKTFQKKIFYERNCEWINNSSFKKQ